MNSKVKVLITSMGGGGAERQVSYLYKAGLVEKIYTLEDECAYDLPKASLSNVFSKNFKLSFIGIVKSLLFGPFLFSKLFSKNDIVLSFLELSNFVNILSKLFKSHRAIVSVRISPDFYNSKKLGFTYKFLMRLLYPYASLIITNSEKCKQDLLKFIDLDKSKIKVIKNALDLDKINLMNSDSKVFFDESILQLVSIGRLSYQKNYESMLEILSRVVRLNPRVKLLILGEGESREKLLNHAKNLSLKTATSLDESEASVFFLGFQSNPYRYLNTKSVFLLTSHYEGLPNVVLEAMACGVPVISADCSTGPREILAPSSGLGVSAVAAEWCEYGVLLPVPVSILDYDEWAGVIVGLSHDFESRERLSSKSFERSGDYSMNKVIGSWREVIAHLSSV